MAYIKVKNKNITEALKVFSYQVYKEDILNQFMKKQEFVKPSTKKRERKKKSVFLEKLRSRNF